MSFPAKPGRFPLWNRLAPLDPSHGQPRCQPKQALSDIKPVRGPLPLMVPRVAQVPEWKPAGLCPITTYRKYTDFSFQKKQYYYSKQSNRIWPPIMVSLYRWYPLTFSGSRLFLTPPGRKQ